MVLLEFRVKIKWTTKKGKLLSMLNVSVFSSMIGKSLWALTHRFIFSLKTE